MLHPERIENVKINLALNLAHSLFAKFNLFVAVEFFDCGESELIAILLFAHKSNRINQILIEIEDGLELFFELLVNTRAKLSKLCDLVFVEASNLWADIVAVENLATHRIDDFAMAVNNVIVLDNVLAAIEVEAFDAFLCGFKRLANHAVANRHIIINAKALHDHRDAIALEDTHKVIFARDKELSRTRIALTTTTTTELVIDAARIMTSSTNHDETTEFSDAISKLNIGTTTRHVSSESNCTFFASLCNNRGLALVILCVQNFEWNVLFFEVSSDAFVVCDRIGTNEHWLTAIMVFMNLSSNRLKLGSFSAIDKIVFIDTNDWLVRWNLNYIERINLLELFCLSKCRTGHTGKLIVKTEEVLEGNSCESSRLFTNLDTFLSFDSLMKTFIVAAAMHETTSVLINNHNLARVSDNIILIALEESLCAESLLEMINNTSILSAIESLNTKNLLDFFYASISQGNRAAFFIDNIIFVGKLSADLSELIVALWIVCCWSGDNKWRTSLINQDRVDLIDDREV